MGFLPGWMLKILSRARFPESWSKTIRCALPPRVSVRRPISPSVSSSKPTTNGAIPSSRSGTSASRKPRCRVSFITAAPSCRRACSRSSITPPLLVVFPLCNHQLKCLLIASVNICLSVDRPDALPLTWQTIAAPVAEVDMQLRVADVHLGNLPRCPVDGRRERDGEVCQISCQQMPSLPEVQHVSC